MSWFDWAFRLSFNYRGLSPDTSVKNAMGELYANKYKHPERVEVVVEAIVRMFTTHATSFSYRYDKLPVGRDQMLSIDMWQRRLQEGCGDCEDKGLLMLSMRNAFLDLDVKGNAFL